MGTEFVSFILSNSDNLNHVHSAYHNCSCENVSIFLLIMPQFYICSKQFNYVFLLGWWNWLEIWINTIIVFALLKVA